MSVQHAQVLLDEAQPRVPDSPHMHLREVSVRIRKSCRPMLGIVWMFLLLVPNVCLAQQDTGNISGTVLDASGAVVPGCNVGITNQATGVRFVTTSNSAGFFASPPLQVGTYAVELSKPGFNKVVQRDIVIDAAARFESQFTLSVGKTDVSITVTTEGTGMNTTDATVGAVIDQRAAQELPLNGRAVLALATLTPGVVSGEGAVYEGFNDRGVGVSAIRISGGALGVNNVLLDAANNLQSYLGEIAINPKSDAVSEFRIQSGQMSAQFGYTSGGVINVVTRSGTNAMHGSIYEFFRNDVLDAKGHFASKSVRKPELRYNQPGIAIGGPIRHDKLFYFANYEVYRLIQESTSFASVPTASQRTGNFSDFYQLVSSGGQQICSNVAPTRATPYVQIYDPQSGNSTASRQAFPGNVIPASRLDPVALGIQTNFYPLPNNSSGTYNPCTNANNYTSNSRIHSNDQQGIGRLDWTVSPKLSIFARYGYYQNNTDNNGVLDVTASGRRDALTNQLATLGLTSLITDKVVNQLRVSALRSDFPFQAGSTGQNWPAQLGLPGVSPLTLPSISNGLPAFNTTYGFRASTSFQVVDDVTLQHRRQTYHVGFDWHLDQAYNNQNAGPSGTFSFSAATTGFGTSSTATAGTGNQYASFLLGAASSASDTVTVGTMFREFRVAGYVQDDWQITPRLTLNLGLRYDFQQQPYELHNGIGNFDISQNSTATGYLGRQVYAGVNGYGRNFVKENYADLGPRAGFALLLRGDGSTVLRGGFGIYYPTNANNNYALSAGSNNGFGILTTTYSAVAANGIALLLKNGLPFAPNQPSGANAGQDAFLGQTGVYIRQDAKTSQSQQYTMTLSQRVGSLFVLDVTYLGNHGIHFPVAPYNLNQLNPSHFNLGTKTLTSTVPNPYAGKVPGTLGASTITQANLLRPYPYMSAVTANYPHDGNYDGNFLYVQGQRRFSHGLELLASYTYGKLLTDPIFVQLGTIGGVTASSAGSGVGSFQSIYNRAADHSVDANDVTHRLTASALYNLPFGSHGLFFNHPGALERVVSGWQYNTVMTAQTGRPLGITGATNQGIANRPNYVPGVSTHVPNPTAQQWFNPGAFSDPADYTYGNLPRFDSRLRAPGALNFDMSLFKTTKIRESSSIQLRIEAFNIFNHPNLGMPNTTFVAGSPANPANPFAEGGLNTSSTFGQITSALPQRILQVAVKFEF